jgi:hypothetical protein
MRTFAASLAAALLLSASLALAGTVTVRDGNDTPGRIDIRSVRVTTLPHRKLRFVLTFYDDVPARGEVGNEYVYIWKARPHPLPGAPPGAFQEAPYTVQMPQTGPRPVYTGGGEEGAPTTRHGTAIVTRKGRVLTVTLPLKAIGNPKGRFFWYVQSNFYGPEATCPGGPCTDHAPNGRQAVKQTL